MMGSALRRSPMVSNSGTTIRSVTAASCSRRASARSPLSSSSTSSRSLTSSGVRDDVVADRRRGRSAAACAPPSRRSPARWSRARCSARAHAQRPRVVEQAAAAASRRRLGQRRVVGLDARGLQQLGHHGLVLVRSSGAGRPWRGGSRTPAPRASAAPGAARSAPAHGASSEASITQVGEQPGGVQVRVLRRHGVAQRLVPVSSCSVAARRA